MTTVHDALEILTGMTAGQRDASGQYPDGTLLARAREKAHEFWQKTLLSPAARARVATAQMAEAAAAARSATAGGKKKKAAKTASKRRR